MENFFHHLSELVQNEACFRVNVQLPGEHRVIQWQGASDLNHIVRNYNNFGEYLKSTVSVEKHIDDLIKRFDEDKFIGQQTFVLMIGKNTAPGSKKYFPLLKKLHTSKKLDVIIYCHLRRCPNEAWMHLHRLIITSSWSLERIHLEMPSQVKNLLDVIKEPTFDRYDFASRSMLLRKNFFNETCLKGVTKIYMRSFWFFEGYLKFVIAILRTVNAIRSKERIEPLKFVYDSGFRKDINQLLTRTYGDSNLLFDSWGIEHSLFGSLRPSLYVDADQSQSVLIKIYDYGSQTRNCFEVVKKGGYCYRLASLRETILSIFSFPKEKPFETPDDLYEMMNEDLCKRQNSREK